MSILEAAGLPEQFGLLVLSIGVVLLLSPYLSGSDLGVIKIPTLPDNAKRSLKIVGPLTLAVAIGVHLRILETEIDEPEPPPETSTQETDGPEEFSGEPPTTSATPCVVSGTVFDLNTNNPISALSIGVLSDNGESTRPVPLDRNVATTGPDGRFTFPCDHISESAFPIQVSVRHRDWVATHLGPRVTRPGEWQDVNFPIDLKNVDLVDRTLEEIGLSFGSRSRDASRTLVAGNLVNKSDKSYSCVRITFFLSRKGERSGVKHLVFRDVNPNETRAYEADFPPDVGFGIQSKAEC